jgi:hypothetical protein
MWKGSNGSAAAPVEETQVSGGIPQGAEDPDVSDRPSRSALSDGIIELAGTVSKEAEKRFEDDARSRLFLALAKHLAHRNHPDLPVDFLCMGQGTVYPVAKGAVAVQLPLRSLWELYLPEAEQTVELVCMEWQLAAEVLKIRRVA